MSVASRFHVLASTESRRLRSSSSMPSPSVSRAPRAGILPIGLTAAPAGSAPDDPPGAVPVQPPPVRGQEHRPFGVFADGQVDRPGGARR